MSSQDYRTKCLAQKINACYACGDSHDLIVHHINGDRNDNRLDNLVPMCRGCHSKVHGQVRLSGVLKDLQEQLPESSLRFGGRTSGGGGRSRALLTEKEREQIAGEHGDNRRYQATSRVRRRVTEELTRDVDVLREHHPDLLEEIREVVCDENEE